MVPAWILLFGLAVCTCFLGLYALWSEPENHLIPEVLEKLHKHYAGFTSALGLPNDRLARALFKQAPTNVHPPLDSSSSDCTASPASESPDTPVKHPSAPTRPTVVGRVTKPQLNLVSRPQGDKHTTLQKVVNDRALANALFGASLPESPSLRYKQQCFTRSYLQSHGCSAKEAYYLVQYSSVEQMYNLLAGSDFHPAATQDIAHTNKADVWEAAFDLHGTKAWHDDYGKCAKANI